MGSLTTFNFLKILSCTILTGSAWAQPILSPDFDGRDATIATTFAVRLEGLLQTTSKIRSLPRVFRPAEEPVPIVVVAAPDAEILAPDDFFNRLALEDVIYAGEEHDNHVHHQIQREVLRQLHARRSNVIVGLEMFDITQQQILDDYIEGRMPESEFEKIWNRTWGHSFDLYRPVLDYAKTTHIPLRALNAPRSVVSQIAKGGLDSLTPQQRKVLPETIYPIEEPRYLEFVKRSIQGHGPLDPDREARMLQAMTVWNETMGASVVEAAAKGPVLVVAGFGHMIYGAGILESVRRRVSLRQKTVLPYPLDDERASIEELRRRLRRPDSPDVQLSDYFWLLPQQNFKVLLPERKKNLF